MNISITSKVTIKPAMQKINSNDFWKEAAHEWWRIYYDYVPHDTGQLRNNVQIKPREIVHKEPYASFIYYGALMVDPEFDVGGFTHDGGISWFSRPGVKKRISGRMLHLKNGSREWDKKAKLDKKDELLARSMQNWIDRNL